MYEQKFPEVDDVVVVQVTKIAEMGAYVSLLEYNGIEGMILLSELSRRRIRSINKLIKARIRNTEMGASGVDGTALGGGGLCCMRLSALLSSSIHTQHTGGAARACHGASCGQGEGLHRFVKEVGSGHLCLSETCVCVCVCVCVWVCECVRV